MRLSNEEQVEKWRDHPWFPIIERTHRDLEEHIPGYTIGQVPWSGVTESLQEVIGLRA